MMVQYRSRERLSSCGDTSSTGTTPPFAASPLHQGLHYGSAMELQHHQCSPLYHQLPRYTPASDGRNMSPPAHIPAQPPAPHQMLLAQSPPLASGAGILHGIGSTAGSTASTATPSLRFVPQPLSEETLMDVCFDSSVVVFYHLLILYLECFGMKCCFF